MIRLLTGLLLICSLASAQNKIVEGRIVDKDSDQPVPFASIGVIGTSKGTSSNLNGQFSVAVPDNFSLRISCLGYETLEVTNLSLDDYVLIKLKPSATQLKEIVVFNRQVNPKRLVQKAFASIDKNYNTNPFVQKFFYRHYCKDDSVYGRLIEASVDIWRRKGYKSKQPEAGIQDEIRVTQLRRSFDKTLSSQGHVPIAVKSILQADIAGYQESSPSEHLSFHSEVSHLQSNLEKYTFSFEGLTYYDGKEVYEVAYALKPDSVPTTTGFMKMPGNKGSLFITTDRYVFVKSIDVKFWDLDTVKTTSYYTPYNGKYYPYHLVRDGKTVGRDKSTHWFHVELMASEILVNDYEQFYGKEPSKFELLKIPYDSVFWTNNTTLKTTPLEDEIILDLGGGASLSDQFKRYHAYEMNKLESSNADDRFKWYKEESQGKRILYITFWNSECKPCIQDFEAQKRLIKRYKDQVGFVLLSLDDDEKVWRKLIERYNLSIEGFTHYRIGKGSTISSHYQLKEIPFYILIDKKGNDYQVNARHPHDPHLVQDLDLLIGGSN